MIYHHCLNIEMALTNPEMLKGVFEVDDKPLTTKREIKRFLKGQRKLGRKVLPICECGNFDYQKGCLGHND